MPETNGKISLCMYIILNGTSQDLKKQNKKKTKKKKTVELNVLNIFFIARIN